MDTIRRFDSCVDNYRRYREGYPPSLYKLLQKRFGLSAITSIADIGSGTGNLSRLFLQHNHLVHAVEPDERMRLAAEEALAQFQTFVSVAGTADNTTLPPASVDGICVGQAFHWFSLEPAREEMSRILKPTGWVALVWNVRCTEASALMRSVENINLDFGTDYRSVKERGNLSSLAERCFGDCQFETVRIVRHRALSLEQFRGKLLSQSYLPKQDHPRYGKLLKRIDHTFRYYQTSGRVRFSIATEAYLGRLKAPSVALPVPSRQLLPEAA